MRRHNHPSTIIMCPKDKASASQPVRRLSFRVLTQRVSVLHFVCPTALHWQSQCPCKVAALHTYPGGSSRNSLRQCFSANRLASAMYGDNVIEKHGINRDRTGDREKTRYLCGKQGIFTRDRALIRPGFIRQLETRASTRSASFFHALGSPGRPHNGGGEAGAYRTRNGAKPLKQGHLRAKRGPLGPSRKSQQQTKRTGFAAHGHSIAETAPEGKRASCANGALIRA